MGKFVWTDAHVEIGGVDLSDHVESLNLNYSQELLDATSMGDANRTRVPGFTDWSLQVNFRQDFDASSVDATLFPLIGSATATAIVVRPTTAVAGETNPEFTGNAWLEDYSGPVAGSVNQVANTSAQFQGEGSLARSVGA